MTPENESAVIKLLVSISEKLTALLERTSDINKEQERIVNELLKVTRERIV